jgi:hypothetical protein
MEWPEQVAAEPAAAVAAWRRPGPSAEIEELRGSGADDADQQRNRDTQRRQRAGLGENLQKRLRLEHAHRSQWQFSTMIAESGRKRAMP